MGAGKSKLIRRLTHHYTTPEVFLEKNLLPIQITYKDLLDTYEGEIDKLIQGVISQHLHDELGEENYLLLIDGVDEKNLSTDTQISTLHSVLSNIEKDSRVRAVVTTRPLEGLDQAEGLKHIYRCHIRPLSLSKTIEFMKNICIELNLTDRIIEDLKKSPLFRELPRSPIAAIILAKLLNENSKDLPSNMTELYAKYTELILGRWDIEKGLQSQKEYQTLDNIMMEIANYMIENEINTISIDDAKKIFEDYLRNRHLGLNSEILFNKLIQRCDIIGTDIKANTLFFKHRTFAEFFYAKRSVNYNILSIDQRVFHLYWMNVFFFHIGLLKDCPDILTRIITMSTTSEAERWLKIINMSNYFLAGYTSPYNIISKGVTDAMIEAAKLYNDIVSGIIESPFSEMPKMDFLFMMQWLIRHSYSYEFFDRALEDAVLSIAAMKDDEVKAYALFFVNVSYIELGKGQSFDFLLQEYSGALPLDLTMAVRHESKSLKERTKLMKKQDSRVKMMLKNNPSLCAEIEKMYKAPMRHLNK